jgi:hypothetical protein
LSFSIPLLACLPLFLIFLANWSFPELIVRLWLFVRELRRARVLNREVMAYSDGFIRFFPAMLNYLWTLKLLFYPSFVNESEVD